VNTEIKGILLCFSKPAFRHLEQLLEKRAAGVKIN